MPDYKRMYFHLAGKVADAVDLLVQAQRECEEMVLSENEDCPENNLILLDPPLPREKP